VSYEGDAFCYRSIYYTKAKESLLLQRGDEFGIARQRNYLPATQPILIYSSDGLLHGKDRLLTIE